ncbi:MAG: hypothetical protein IKV88_00380 [Clostridia bacterium]|nr:hypothetical protein [Clostridia bacterium]
MRKLISSILLFCMIFSLLPSFSSYAGENDVSLVNTGTRYESVIQTLTMDPGSTFNEDYKSVSNAPEGKDNIARIIDLSDSENPEDASHGNVAHLKIHGNPAAYSNAGYTISNRTEFQKEPYNSDDVVSFSFDINVLKMETEPMGILGYIADVTYTGFCFEGENLYVSTDYGKGATDKASRITIPMENGTWHTLQYIFDDRDDTIYHIVDGEICSRVPFAGTGKTLDLKGEKSKKFYPEFFLRQKFAQNKECEVYIDNVKILSGRSVTMSLSVPDYAPVGSKIELKPQFEGGDGLNLLYYINGKRVNSSKRTVYVTIPKEGENIIEAHLTDDDGNIVVSSEKKCVTGVFMNLKDVHKPLTMETGACFSSDYRSLSGSPEGLENIAEIVDLSDSPFPDDASHGNAAHLKIHGNPGVRSSAGYSLAQRTIFRTPPYDKTDIISFSFDIKVEKMDEMPMPLLGYIADTYYCGFSFEGENLYISTDFSKGAQSKNSRITLPMKNGTWHTLQYIFDDNNKIIYHIADGVMYSAVPFEGSSKTLDLSSERAKNFYPEFILRGDFESGKECEVYLDNVNISYGAQSDIIFKNLTMSSGDIFAMGLDDVNCQEGIELEFDVSGAVCEKDIMCIATLGKTSDKSLCDIAISPVAFEEGESRKKAKLVLDSLPEGLNGNDYELCLMIWEKDTLKPLMTKEILTKKEEFKNSSDKINFVKNGTFMIEAEELEYSDEVAIISESDASGGLALKSTAAAFAPSHEDVENVAMSLSIEVPAIEEGQYCLWMRVKCTSSANYSFWAKYTGYGDYKARYIKINPEYQWVNVANVFCCENTFEYKIKHRDPGFKIDKFIFTRDPDFNPVNINDTPNLVAPGLPEPESLYEAPPVFPPENTHPRLLVTKEMIPELKENASHPALEPMYKEAKRRANLEMNCKLADKNGGNNINLYLAFDIECRAYMYLLGEVDENHAKQTVEYLKDLLSTVTWDRSVGDITRNMGTLISTAAIVYDWCYDVLTEEDKQEIIRGIKRTAGQMEIGYPPKTYEIFAGHGGEGEVLYYQLACAIAIYDEEPDMYNYVAGLLFQHMFGSRKLFTQTGSHPAGSAYGAVRLAWEQLSSIVFDRMGYPEVMGDQMDKSSMRWIYDRLPNGYWFEDGDSWISINKNQGPVYDYNAYPTMLYGAYHNDNKYLRGEYLRELSLKGYVGGTDIYNNAVLTLVTLNPSKGYIYPDDEGKELPLSYFTSYPLTQGFMRTSWKEGIDSETALVFMNGQEKLVGDHDHEHSDIGNFQIYYKGVLTGHGGTYAGQNGGWGAEHNYNYYRRTISQNCLTVFDPNEVFSHQFRPDYVFSNDGGQKIEKNTNFLHEFLSHPDEAKTEGKYAGPNKETPEFTYLKTDLTNAYSDKIKGYTRSMVAINLFNTDYPLAFICYDNVTSSDKDFKKTWNLQSIHEPEIEGNQTVIKRKEYGYSGQLVVNTYLPKDDNLTISTVGGEGFESYVNGVNYPNPDKEGYDHEQCDWRVEVSPKTASEDDLFLNAMYVTDTNKNLPKLPMFMEESEKFVGVTVMDRVVLFSKTREKINEGFSLNVRDNGYGTMCTLITDLEEGNWKITSDETSVVVKVNGEENALYVRLTPGTYTVSKADGETPAEISYKRDERVERVGDVYVYDRGRRLFEYTKNPTVLRDSVPYLSEEDMEKNGMIIERCDNEITVEAKGCRASLTMNSNVCTKDGTSVTIQGAPFEKDGILYLPATDFAEFFGRSFTYDSLARIIKLK